MAPEKGIPTIDEVRRLPATVDVVTAGKALGLGRSRAYDLARKGEFPCRVLTIGHTYRVLTAELLRLLGLAQPDTSPA
ncbi:MAG: DNA-binding protein [Micromonosporaceae bacterium]